jgi:hypothetical protein
MELVEFIEPARTTKGGEEIVTISSPSSIKIQITGPGAQTILNTTPPAGKVWRIRVCVEVVETDG